MAAGEVVGWIGDAVPSSGTPSASIQVDRVYLYFDRVLISIYRIATYYSVSFYQWIRIFFFPSFSFPFFSFFFFLFDEVLSSPWCSSSGCVSDLFLGLNRTPCYYFYAVRASGSEGAKILERWPRAFIHTCQRKYVDSVLSGSRFPSSIVQV